MKKIILITGGERSGKSVYAEQLALSLSSNPVYLATARIWDEEFRQRVAIHRERRGPQWTNIEEEKHLSRHDLTGRTVLVDCVTLWATNFFFDHRPQAALPAHDGTETVERRQARAGIRQVEETLQAIQEEFMRFTAQDATFIFVTNEIGMGGTSEHPAQRRFTDLQGGINRYIAEKADRVVFLVSGCPLIVKDNINQG